MKKILAIVLCIAAILSLAIPAAADSDRFLHSRYTVDSNNVLIHSISGIVDAVVSSDGADVERITLSTVEETDTPITYFCVMDLSSSMTRYQQVQQKDLLLAINERMRPQDQMILARMTTDLDIVTDLDSEEARAEAISAKGNVFYLTNIYQSIVQVMEMVSDTEIYPDPVVVIFMSDGMDDKKTDVTLEDAQAAISASDASFYTVITLDSYFSPTQKEIGESFGDLASYSIGGKCYSPARDKLEATEIANNIVDDVLGSVMLLVDGSRLDRSSDTVNISIKGVSDSNVYTGSIPVDTRALASIPVYVPPTEAPTFASEPSFFEENKSMIFIGASAVVLLVLAAVITLFVVRRNNEDEYDGLEFMEEENSGSVNTETFTAQLQNLTFPVDNTAEPQEQEEILDLIPKNVNKSEPSDVEAILKQFDKENTAAKAASKKEEAPVKKEAPAKEAAPVKKEAPVKEAAPVKKEAPVKEAAPVKKEAPVKEAAPAKKAEPVKEAAPAKKAEPVKEAAPAKKAAPVKEAPAKVAEKFETVSIPDIDDDGFGLDEKPAAAPAAPAYVPAAPAYVPAAPAVPEVPAGKPSPSCRLKVISANSNKTVVTALLNADVPKSFGRTQRSNYVLNPNDNNLSGLQFSLKWDTTRLLLKDLNSTNGTGVNRALVQPGVWLPIANNSTIQAGASEYIIQFTNT